MTTASTEAPDFVELEDSLPQLSGYYPLPSAGYLDGGPWEGSALSAFDLFPADLILRYYRRSFVAALSWETYLTGGAVPVRVLEYEGASNRTFAVDFGEPLLAFPEHHRETVQYLRARGRPVLADRVVTMLQAIRDDPDEQPVDILSLQEMARLFVEQQGFADPYISPGRRGIVHTQWRLDGNGALVWGFLGNEKIMVVAQVDEFQGRAPLDISTSGTTQDILEDYGHLVPTRN